MSLLLMIRQFRDAVTTHFEASKDVTPAISAREYSDFQEEGRRLSNQFIRLKRELLGIFDLTKFPFSELFPSMVRDYTAVSLYCSAIAWNARPDLDNYGSPAEEGRQASHHDWKSLFDFCVPDLQTSFPNIGMTPNNDIDAHLKIFRMACDEILDEFPITDQQEARRQEAEMNRPADQVTTINVLGSGNTIVNHSTVTHAFNRVKAAHSEEVAKMLLDVEAAINKSGNKEAAENFESFNEELAKPEPKKSLLKTLWQGTLAALPTLKELPDVVAKISALFA
ncbi:hypothetical protein ABIB99_008855 [Bradyrhizobium sp. LA6.1]|uniref:hypothetical protein n=1 Tax=Bradyrhizobium sp. LA6.1 TaxID=3156378 RepID=UPI003392584D